MTPQDEQQQDPSVHDNTLTFTYSGSPVRLDHFLHRQFPEISIRKWKQAIGSSAVTVNQHRGQKGTLLANAVTVSLPSRLPASLAAGPPAADLTIQLAVIFEDEDLLVINKPAGIHTHPLSTKETGTVANGLIAAYPALKGIGFSPLQPGLLNRLDRDTSGLVLVAKSKKSWEAYRQWFIQKKVSKIYLGIVHGILNEPLTIELPLIHHPRRHDKMTVHIPNNHRGRQLPATTFIESLSHSSTTTRVRLTMKTGVMHQLRVHAAAAGHPLVGDLVYGRPVDKNIAEQSGSLRLHAYQLQFPNGRQFTAPLDWESWS